MKVTMTDRFNPFVPGMVVWALIRAARVVEMSSASSMWSAEERRALLRLAEKLRLWVLVALERCRDQ